MDLNPKVNPGAIAFLYKNLFISVELVSVLMVLFFVPVNAKIKARFGPTGMGFNDTTSCVEFSKNGRFNPYSVLYEKWFVFYYWAPPLPLETYIFTFPTANHTKYLHKILDENTILPVNWSARQILMENQYNVTTLLVERSDRGEYWNYPLYRLKHGRKTTPRDVRLKQTSDNKILGFMECDDDSLRVMSRIDHVPPKKKLYEEASRLGYKGRRGKSYLYQGHEWMPIPEDDEENYWEYHKTIKPREKSSNEDNSKEQSKEDVDSNKKKKAKNKKSQTDDLEAKLNAEHDGQCVKIEPELWDDPKPRGPDPELITRQELDNVDLNAITTSITIDTSLSDKNQEDHKVENSEYNPIKVLDTVVLETKYSTPDSSFPNKLDDTIVQQEEKDSAKEISSINTTASDTTFSNKLDSLQNNIQEENILKKSKYIIIEEVKTPESGQIINEPYNLESDNKIEKKSNSESRLKESLDPIQTTLPDYSHRIESLNKPNSALPNTKPRTNSQKVSKDIPNKDKLNLKAVQLPVVQLNEEEPLPDLPKTKARNKKVSKNNKQTKIVDEKKKTKSNVDDDDEDCYVCYNSEPVKSSDPPFVQNLKHEVGPGSNSRAGFNPHNSNEPDPTEQTSSAPESVIKKNNK